MFRRSGTAASEGSTRPSVIDLDTLAILTCVLLLTAGFGLMLLGDSGLLPDWGPLQALGALCGLGYLLIGGLRYPVALIGLLCAVGSLAMRWRVAGPRERGRRTALLALVAVLTALLLPGHLVLDFALRNRVERTCGTARLQAWAAGVLREHEETGSDLLDWRTVPTDIRKAGSRFYVSGGKSQARYVTIRSGGGGFIEETWGYHVVPDGSRPRGDARWWKEGLYTFGCP